MEKCKQIKCTGCKHRLVKSRFTINLTDRICDVCCEKGVQITNPFTPGCLYKRKQRSLLSCAKSNNVFQWALQQMQSRGTKFYLIRNVFSVAECEAIKRIKPTVYREKIIFANSTKRFQQTIYESWRNNFCAEDIPSCLLNLLNEFSACHVETCFYTCKFLISEGKCPQQHLHCDDREFSSDYLRRYKHAPYSMLIALESDCNSTRLVVDPRGTEIIIPQGSLLLFRSDFVHGGAAYDMRNMRLFIATGTQLFKNEGIEVYIVDEVDED